MVVEERLLTKVTLLPGGVLPRLPAHAPGSPAGSSGDVMLARMGEREVVHRVAVWSPVFERTSRGKICPAGDEFERFEQELFDSKS